MEWVEIDRSCNWWVKEGELWGRFSGELDVGEVMMMMSRVVLKLCLVGFGEIFDIWRCVCLFVI